MHFTILSDEDLEKLELAIELVIEESMERGLSLGVSDFAARLFEAYSTGERDPDRLAEAVLFELRPQRLH